ncbi:Late embryogenesis abundant protein, LEA_2 subgroup [Dillenia turbinata]|uniref:Late embryogenesis abundant protein, LEA_2 subgroup n=1 Tax=Dillenia turbinata TaxID=194707 RepID=A0AAN8W133_9MAGN
MVRDCGRHGEDHSKTLKWVGIVVGILIFLSIVVFIIVRFLVWCKNPIFILQDISVYAFNVSLNPNLLTSTFQVTVSSHNPNDNAGIYYDKLDIYAAYQSQRITLGSSIPPTYQGDNKDDIWSPFIYGTSVPVAPFLALALCQDQSVGSVLLTIKIDGRMRWKVGSVITGPYHLHADCLATITFGSGNTGIVVGDAVKYLLIQRCDVNV